MGSINKDKVWVLSVDGGGIRGLIPALILDKLEKELSAKLDKDVRIADIFDVVAGTSTGSIISLGLTVSDEKTNRPKYRASDLVKIYTEDGNKVFSKGHFWESNEITIKMKQDPVVGIFDYIYSSTMEVEESLTTNITIQSGSGGIFSDDFTPEGFENLLKDKFGDKTLKDTLRDVLIPAYNITETKVAYFTNDSNYPDSYKISDVILASSAAPTYFPAKQIDNNLYIDGSVFMNDPAFEAYLEAKKKFPQAKKIVICSLGTGYFQGALKQLAKSGSLRWAAPLISCMMNTSSKLVGSYLENLKTEQDFNYYRLQCELTEEIPLCDTSQKTFEKLEDYANNIIKSTEFKNLVDEIVEHQEN